MSQPIEPPAYQSAAQHALRYSLGSAFFGMLGVVDALLFFAALDKALKITPITPALKAGMGFFGCMTVACAWGYFWVVRRIPVADHLIVGERIVTTRWHRDTLVFKASHCLYFAGVLETQGYRRALSGLVVGTHVFYLTDGAYLTEAGVRRVIGKNESRSAIVFMRAFQEFALRRKPNAPTALE